MVAYTTYAKALFPKGHGHPLWEPDPGEYAPMEIADVGYISDGGFIKLFNASSRIDDWSNRLGYPERHTPLLVGDIRRRTLLPKKPEYISSEGVQKKGVNLSGSAGPSVQVGGGISFECVKNQGAVLVMGDIAYRQDAVDLARFSDYIVANHRAWLAFANERLGRGLSVTDLILVTGCDKTSDWACAAWSDSSHSASASFVVEAPGIVQSSASIWGHWESSSSIDRNAGPQRLDPTIPTNRVSQSSDAMSIDGPPSFQEPSHVAPLVPPTSSNQCVFVRGFHMGHRNTWFRRKTIVDVGDGLMTIRKPLDLKNKENKDLTVQQTPQQRLLSDDPPTAQDGSAFHNADSESVEIEAQGNSEQGSDSDEEVELEYVDFDKSGTPVEAMISFMLKNSTAELALIHDDDLVDLIQHSSVPAVHDYKIWIGQLSPVVYLDVGNVGMFRGTYTLRMSANGHEKNDTLPLLAGDKGSISRDDRSTHVGRSIGRSPDTLPLLAGGKDGISRNDRSTYTGPGIGLPRKPGLSSMSVPANGEVLSWTNQDPRESQLFNSWGVLYRFQTTVGPDGLSTTTLFRALRKNKEERVARLEWAPNGGLGRAQIGKKTLEMRDLVQPDPHVHGARVFAAPDGLFYRWTPIATSRDILLQDSNGHVVAFFRPTRPTRYQIGDVHGELHFFPTAGSCTIMHPPIMDCVVMAAMLFRFCTAFGF